jgi:hypothetical protein
VLDPLMQCVQDSGVSLLARVAMAQGSQHVGDMPSFQNEHA